MSIAFSVFSSMHDRCTTILLCYANPVRIAICILTKLVETNVEAICLAMLVDDMDTISKGCCSRCHILFVKATNVSWIA